MDQLCLEVLKPGCGGGNINFRKSHAKQKHSAHTSSVLTDHNADILHLQQNISVFLAVVVV